jgi:hypothetical protein
MTAMDLCDTQSSALRDVDIPLEVRAVRAATEPH